MRLTSALYLTVGFCFVASTVGAQSLGEVAAKAKAAREAVCKAEPETCLKAPAAPTVLTNKDLPAAAVTAPPVPMANEESAVVTVPSSPSPAAVVATSGPTAAQRLDLERTKARTALREAQQALRDGERAERELQHTYENTCREDQVTITLIRACADMRYDLRYRGPSALSDLRSAIRALARGLGLDPEAAVR